MERLLRCWLCPSFYLNGDFACVWLVYLLVCKLYLTLSHTHKNSNNSKDFNCDSCNLWSSSPFIQFMMIIQSIYSSDAWMSPQPFLSSDWPLVKNWSHIVVTHERGHTLKQITGEPLSFIVMFLGPLSYLNSQLPTHWRPHLKTARGSSKLTLNLTTLRM